MGLFWFALYHIIFSFGREGDGDVSWMGESRPDGVLHARFWGEAGMKCRYSGALERVRYWWGIFLERRSLLARSRARPAGGIW